MGANNRETYHKRKNEGLCPNCGSMRIEEGKTYCKDCVKMISNLNKDRMDRFRASGLCRLCGDHLTDNDRLKNGKMPTSCKACRDYRRKYEKIRTRK